MKIRVRKAGRATVHKARRVRVNGASGRANASPRRLERAPVTANTIVVTAGGATVYAEP